MPYSFPLTLANFCDFFVITIIGVKSTLANRLYIYICVQVLGTLGCGCLVLIAKVVVMVKKSKFKDFIFWHGLILFKQPSYVPVCHLFLTYVLGTGTYSK